MLPTPPASAQRRVTTWTKMVLSLTMLGFIAVCTLLGVVLGPHITVLGIFLNLRAILQYYFAYRNNMHVITAHARAIVDGIFSYMPNLDEDARKRLNRLVGKKLTIDQFIEAAEDILGVEHGNLEFWKKVAYHTIAVLQEKGYDVEMTMHFNIPIYHMVVDELKAVFEALERQIFPPTRVMAVPNGDDLEGEPVRPFIDEFIQRRVRKAEERFAAGVISKDTRDFLVRQWMKIDLSDGDKRSAMTAAWLTSFGVEETDLDAVVGELFDNPEKPLALMNAGCTINVNVDSDTIAHPFASFITYLAFVQFGIAGLTSNVRISNISNRLDRSLPLGQALEKWFLSWLNYFKYDYANNVERAAQSWFRCVVCMSGPWMAVLTSTIPSFLGRFVNYTLRGVRIKPGDDRKVTYELNRQKLGTLYDPWVVDYTDAPDEIARYCSIQDRWTMSMYANFFTSLLEGQIWLLHPWTIVDQMYAAGFTFLVIAVFVRLFLHMFYVGFIFGFGVISIPALILAVGLILLMGVYSALRQRSGKGFFTVFSFKKLSLVSIVSLGVAYAGLSFMAPDLIAMVNTSLREMFLVLVPYGIIFATINLVRGFYAVWDNHWDWRGMLNSVYFFLVVLYLIPIKINRLMVKGITPRTYKWSGR